MWKYRFTSRFERRLNRTLWWTAVAAAVGSVTQHVVLINVPERFALGAEIGDWIYDLAIAYLASYVLYVLVVRLPVMTDRRNTYPFVELMLYQLQIHARSLIGELQTMARQHSYPKAELPAELISDTVSHDLVMGLCRKIDPHKGFGHRMMLSSDSETLPTEWFAIQAETANRWIRDLQALSPYLSSELTQLLALITVNPIGEACKNVSSLNSDLMPLYPAIMTYVAGGVRIDAYRKDFFGDRTTDEMTKDLMPFLDVDEA